MFQSRIKLKLIALSLFAPLAAGASVPVFTIQGSMRQAMDKNPDVLKAREILHQSEANEALAFSRVFPVVNGDLQASHLKAASSSNSPLFGGDPYNQYRAGLTLTQPLYDSSLFPAYRFSKKDQLIKKYQVDIAERTLSESVLESFYSVLLNERLLQIYKETLKVDNETLAIAERYYRIGRAQKIDVLQLKTQAALLTPKIAQVDNRMRTAAAQLATLLRELDASNIRLKGALASPSTAWVSQMVAHARAELPEVLRARETVNQFENSRDVQMAVYWPKLNFVANLLRSAYDKHDLIDSNTTSWGLSLQLNIPIFAGLSSFRQRASLASQERQLELDETHAADAASVSQIQTEHDFAVAVAGLESSRQAALFGRESLQEAQRSYKLQTINYLQYQSSQQAFLDSQVGYYQAKYNYIVALSKYFNAMGVPSALLVAKLEELAEKGGGE
jgi:outer membrane protein TolC